MSAFLPRLRTGVTVNPQGAGAVVMDPVRREFFRLGALERFLLEHCDGVTPIEDVLREAERHFDAVLSREALDRFLASLARAGLLEPPAGADERERELRPRRVRGSLFYLRVPLADPDALLGRLVQRLGFLYSPVSVALGAGFMMIALAIAVVDWPDIVRDAGRLYRVSAIPEIWLTVWSVVLAHELAHGLTCKRFGGAVHEMGLLLIYFTPAAYCNVSAAWMFPEKRKRVLVSLAGPWLELCVWALATIAWRITDVESGLNEVALVIVATSGIKTLLNLNPFLKLDGYYLLSDLLDMPNLRRRAFRSIGDALRRVFGDAGAGEGATDARERRILFGYGVVALAMTLGFLGYAIAKLGRYVTQDRLLPFVVFFGLLSVKLPRKLRRIFSGREDDAEAFEDDAPSPAAASAAPTNGAAAVRADGEAANGAAHAPRVRRRTLWLVGAAIAAVLLAFLPVDLKVRGAFRTLPRQNADVRALVDGIVAEVTVHEGQMVRPGDVLARLSTTDLDAEAGVLDAQIAQAGARLRLLLSGPRPEDVKVAAAALKTAEGHLPYARDRLALNRTLVESGIVSRQELKLSEEQAVTAEHEVEEARERWRAASTGARPGEIDAARSELRALEVQRRALEDRRARLVIRSPDSGVVATPQAALHELLHRHVEPGDLLAKVYDDRMLTAEIAVSEQDIADVRVGQRVALRARAQPGVTFRGTVQSVAVAAEPTSGSTPSSASTANSSAAAAAVAPRRVLVTTSIDNRDLLLRPEMTGQAKIVCGRRSVAGLIARRLARTFKVDFWAWS